MPTYDYKCKTCKHKFEMHQSIHDDALTECTKEDCDGELTKVFSQIGMSFQGSGFYRNDHGATWKSQLGGDDQ